MRERKAVGVLSSSHWTSFPFMKVTLPQFALGEDLDYEELNEGLHDSRHQDAPESSTRLYFVDEMAFLEGMDALLAEVCAA